MYNIRLFRVSEQTPQDVVQGVMRSTQRKIRVYANRCVRGVRGRLQKRVDRHCGSSGRQFARQGRPQRICRHNGQQLATAILPVIQRIPERLAFGPGLERVLHPTFLH